MKYNLISFLNYHSLVLQKSSINLLQSFDVCIAPNNNLFVTMAFLNISQTSNLGCPMSTPPFIPIICPIQPNLVSIPSSILDIFCWNFLFCFYHLHKSQDSVPLNCGIFQYWCYYLHMFWGIFIWFLNVGSIIYTENYF